MNKHIENLLLMKMQMVWFVLFCVGAVCTAALAALAGTQWNTADGQTRLMIVIGILGNVANTLMALFSSAMKRVKAGEDPFVDSGNGTTTQKISATVATVETKTTETTKP